MDDKLQKKVDAYEAFLNDVLKEDLRRILHQRDAIYEQTADYLQLRTVLEKTQRCHAAGEPLRTRVDVGCNCYMHAVVPDASRVCICVGLGVYVDFTFAEALAFVDRRCAHLGGAAAALTKTATQIKAHVKLVLQGLREIQSISDTGEAQHARDVWG
ncbi:PREDICTED: protein UXT-like [Priapulus caudatus]|uniref:Protein UXT-like n=1 Tax=Priapulus caudatus TaxID=37621 RepID=A0ABM1ESD4_PRICU|nr:PREDICTED: protein UXT-like [Priapulus caudatus]